MPIGLFASLGCAGCSASVAGPVGEQLKLRLNKETVSTCLLVCYSRKSPFKRTHPNRLDSQRRSDGVWILTSCYIALFGRLFGHIIPLS